MGCAVFITQSDDEETSGFDNAEDGNEIEEGEKDSAGGRNGQEDDENTRSITEIGVDLDKDDEEVKVCAFGQDSYSLSQIMV